MKNRLQKFLLRRAGYTRFGRLLTWSASVLEPPYKSRERLAFLTPKGYVSYKADIFHDDLKLGKRVFIGDRVIIYQVQGNGDQSVQGGSVELGDKVALYGDIYIETSHRGKVIIGERTHIQPRCTFNGVVGAIRIGSQVEIASGCAFYPFNHGMEVDSPIMGQMCYSNGDIVIADEAWLGYGVVVLDNVKIGKGAVIGAGSVVTRNIPDYAIAVGAPAKVIKMRGE